MLRRLAALGATLVAASAVALAPLEAAPKRDYAGSAWTILPPGENGSLTFNRNTRDQALMYDALTPRAGSVTLTDIRRTFKQAPLGASVIGGRRERPRAGVTIARDPYGVARVTGKEETDVAYGAGWVTAADRGVLLQLIRGPARLAALDVPGLDPLAVALSGRSFVPSAEAEAFLANQLDAVRSQRTVGPKILALVNSYAAGINGYYRSKGIPAAPFTANDVVEVRGPTRGGTAVRACSRRAARRCGRRWTQRPPSSRRRRASAPSAWRADATAERIRFTSGVLSDTMRWTNRPTFQQLMSFTGHRPRS